MEKIIKFHELNVGDKFKSTNPELSSIGLVVKKTGSSTPWFKIHYNGDEIIIDDHNFAYNKDVILIDNETTNSNNTYNNSN